MGSTPIIFSPVRIMVLLLRASYKAFARGLRMAMEIDPRRAGKIPSSKGVL